MILWRGHFPESTYLVTVLQDILWSRRYMLENKFLF
jgi:hypothetical protein